MLFAFQRGRWNLSKGASIRGIEGGCYVSYYLKPICGLLPCWYDVVSILRRNSIVSTSAGSSDRRASSKPKLRVRRTRGNDAKKLMLWYNVPYGWVAQDVTIDMDNGPWTMVENC